MLKPKLIAIETPQGIKELSEYLNDYDYIAYDCETTGLVHTSEIIGVSVCADESQAAYVILAYWDVASQRLIYLPGMRAAIQPLIQQLTQKRLIMHNAIYDCSMAEAFFKVRLIDALHTDTMVLAHLLDENRRVGLKELATTYFGADVKKEADEMKESIANNGGSLTKANYEMYKADKYLMAKYGAQDALLTYKLFLRMVPELDKQRLVDFFYKDESMPLLKGPTYELNTTGLKIDTQRLSTLKSTLLAECSEAKAFIYQEITPRVNDKFPGTNKKNVFNIGSNQQLSWLLFGQYELEFNTLTKEGKTVCKALGLRLPYSPMAKREFIAMCSAAVGTVYQPEAVVNGKKKRAKLIKDPWCYIACDKTVLKKHSHKYKWIERLLEHNKKLKLLNTYVEGIQERMQYGIIHPGFKQAGTTSGRYSSSNPNFQNLPRDDKRIKECISSRPGKSFVGADYSQLEPRVFAYFSKDARLLDSFRGTDDFYSVIGMEVYGKSDCTPHKDGSPDAFGVKYKRLRDLSKVIALASTYGATAHQLAPTTGKSVEDTKLDIDNYFESFPGVANMMLEAHAEAKTNGAVYSLFGRPRRMPDARKITKLYGNKQHADLPYEARSLLNLAVNHRIQSTGASIVNRAAIRFNENCKLMEIDCRMVLQVHDSLIIECDDSDASTVSILLKDAMENTTQLEGIALEAVPKIGKNLAEV